MPESHNSFSSSIFARIRRALGWMRAVPPLGDASPVQSGVSWSTVRDPAEALRIWESPGSDPAATFIPWSRTAEESTGNALEACRCREVSDVVVEAILPSHMPSPGPVHAAAMVKVLHELEDHAQIGSWVAISIASSSMFSLKRAIQPCRPPAGGNRLGSRRCGRSHRCCPGRGPPSKTFLLKRSLRLTHQVKFSRSLMKVDLRKSRPLRAQARSAR